MLSAYVLEQNRIIPIVCNISPFESLREFARTKFNDYNEIYLKKDISIAQLNDVKGIYRDNIQKTELVGIDVMFEEPKKSNLVLEVDKEDEETSLKKILKYLENKKL
jgi:adenylylsulfate kinase-like enzyme